ncbi:hypothetical protein LCGC14_0347960 [marine sediment metagenome]|uniref:Uncharacterized protein n=1 Tax=marine sediment metagenome TaxID=412755 RepID=A0A0F9THK8_9ZZZZ
MEFFSKQKTKSSNNGATPSENSSSNNKVEAGDNNFRSAFWQSLAGQAPTTEGGQGLASLLGIGGLGGDDNQNALELFDIPTDFGDLHELRRLIAKSDIPAELVQPLMTLLGLAERFASKLVPSLVGWYLVGRIGKNRLGREEFIRATQRQALVQKDDDD